MKWITIKLMQYQLKKAKKKLNKQKYSFMKTAFSNMIKSYEVAIMYLESSNK